MSTFNIPDGTRVSMSGRELVFGETIFTPREATHLLDDTEALHQRIEEDGYLIIRNFHTRQQIQNARREILEQHGRPESPCPGHASGQGGDWRKSPSPLSGSTCETMVGISRNR